MCGIAGYFGDQARNRAAWMTRQLAHRGPDDEGVWASSRWPIAVGNRRLKILDLSPLGHQPMSSPDGRYVLTYNGEIYNYLELRSELQSLGHEFRSQTDTEVLMHVFMHWGPAGTLRLNGMFAFALWDEQERTLLLGRDPLGIKPLYYAERDGSFAFGSEITSVLSSGIRRVDLNPRALESYLRLLWVPEPLTLFDGIIKVEPGTLLSWDGQRIVTQSYWDVPRPSPEPLDEQETRERMRSTLRAAVARQLRSDVPVGAFLSGGLDSTSIVALAAEVGARSLRSYAIGFASADRAEEGAVDDLHYARLAADAFDIPHQEIILSPDVTELLPQMVRHLEDPVADPAAINCYLICKAARETSTVLLSGTGGDELFGGYRKYFSVLLAERYQRIPEVIRRSLIEPVARTLPVTVGRTGLRTIRFTKKFLRYGSAGQFDRFLGYSTYYSADELEDLLGGDPEGANDPLIGVHPLWNAWTRRDTGQDVDRMIYVDLKYYLPGLGLAYMDRASMAASVEVRVPLLDQEVVQLASQLPDSYKVAGMQTKVILREAMRGSLPEPILRRPKAPFAAPIRSWLRRDAAPMTEAYLSAGRVLRRGLLNPATVQRILAEHRSGREDHSLRIWALLTLEVWLQEFMDSPSRFQMPTSAPDLAPVMETA